MTDYRSMYEKQFVGSWDLPDDRDAVVIIDRCEPGEVSNGAKKDKRPLLYLKGKSKPIVLNATNGKTIASLYGNKVEAWVGKPIALYKANVQGVGGGMVEAIRIRPTAPQPKKEPQP